MSFFLEKLNSSDNLRKIIILGILIAIQLLLGRFTIGYKIIQISFTFIPMFLMGKWFGPLWTGIACGVASAINIFIGGEGLLALPFIISAVLGGVMTGWFFYQHRATWLRTIVYQVLVMIIINLILNTLLLRIIYCDHWPVLLTLRPIKELIETPIQIVIIYILGNNRPLRSLAKHFL